MKVSVFQSNTGDCVLLSSTGRHILVDGGFKGSFIDHTRPAVAKIAAQGEKLDLVCVSHIYSDHISGIIQLLDDVLAWRVFDFQRSQGNNRFKEPDFSRPPEISEIWHNGFDTQLAEDMVGVFESTVEMQVQASILGGNLFLAQAGQNLINGEQQAIELAYMVDPALLNIPLNLISNGQPIVIEGRNPLVYSVGSVNIHLLGPFREDLDQLHQEWNIWLRANQRKLVSLQETAEETARRLGLNQEAAMAQMMQMLAAELGDRTEVTTPNLASITFLAEENGQLVLMTGDAHANEIIKGLRLHQFLPPDGGTMHVNALKIQHHGAEAYIDEAFCKTITADHYIFCGNGGHDNPELEVIEMIVNTRVGEGSAVGENPNRRHPFTLWFNSSEADAGTEARSKHMRKVQDLVEALAEDQEDAISFKFLDGESSFEIDLAENG